MRGVRTEKVAKHARSPLHVAEPADGACGQPVTMTFLEGIRDVNAALLERRSITPYRVPKFYREHIARSRHYEQLKRIVEPSLREFAGPGRLDTSGEADNTPT